MAGKSDLIKLAQRLVHDGPYKMEQTSRRVRGRFNGKYAFDTIGARYVWEIPNYPQYYVPTSSLSKEATLTRLDAVDGTNGTAHLGRLTVGGRSTERVILFNSSTLKDLVKIEFRALDQWYEEEVPIFVHPKDPYKRIDILQSSRRVKVALNGVTLAESDNPLFLLETTLRTRYYLPPTSVNWELLTESGTESLCPYKGKANYYNVNIDGMICRDVVWYYRYPTMESAPIAGHLCFYNELVDIWIDGVQEKK